jgi:hypothetical protein
MATYQFPYLDPHQTRLHEPTTWQQELANAIEGIYGRRAAAIGRKRIYEP